MGGTGVGTGVGIWAGTEIESREEASPQAEVTAREVTVSEMTVSEVTVSEAVLDAPTARTLTNPRRQSPPLAATTRPIALIWVGEEKTQTLVPSLV